ncbi:cytochrome P450 2A5-like [Gastrophryne carolinensis]
MYRRDNLPPGPTPLPIIGNLLQLKSGRLMDSFKEIREKYGDVYTIYLGPRRVVVICGYDAVKEALVDQGDVFGMRGLLPCIEQYYQGHGVVFSNGQCWKQLRRFSLQTLKNFGFGKRSIEERIKEEVHFLVEVFKKTNGSPFNPTLYFSQVAANVICSIIFGSRYSYEDPDFHRLVFLIDEIFKSMSSFWGQLYDIYDVILRHLPGPHNRTCRYLQQLEEFTKAKIENDIKTLNVTSARHLVDSFLIRMEEEKHNPTTHFNNQNFYKNTTVLFIAATETVSTTLRHAFLFMLKYPDIRRELTFNKNLTILDKVQAEIDQVIGRQRAPEPEDRDFLPYTDAVIHEIHRYGDVLPMNLPHAVSTYAQFRGYSIPKGTDVFVPLSFVLHDPKYFPDPFTFNPGRFLDEDGRFKKNEAFMVFSAGKRICLGEPMARLEMFLIITTLLQNFDIFSPVESKDLDILPQMYHSLLAFKHRSSMELPATTALLLIVCVIFFILRITHARRHQRKGRLPPGPKPLPFLGNILQMNGKEISKSLNQLREKYGPVFTIYMGGDPVVVLCSCKVVKEALHDKAEDFGARGYMPLLTKLSGGAHGVVASNGEQWKQLRRFTLMTLRNFGMGKRSIEERIQEEAQFLKEEFRKANCQPLDPTFYFAKAVSNVICSVVFGNRFEYEDVHFRQLLGFLHQSMEGFSSGWGQIYNMFPNVVEKIPCPLNKAFKAVDDIQEFVAERVKMHKDTLDPNSPRDFIDCILIKMKQEKDIQDSAFYMKSIVSTTFDLFGAGTETVSTTLRYGFLILLKHADVEERIHEEIDNVIGRSRAPCIEDRARMPYVDAVIHEIQRFIDLVPVVTRKVTRDVNFRGFLIPKGTTVYSMLSSVLRDPEQFECPNQFDPGHFLDKNGKFCRKDGYMPFSIGKRSCVGEGLAKMELFLFFTTVLQNFRLQSPVDPKQLDLKPLMSGNANLPHPYQLSFLPR